MFFQEAYEYDAYGDTMGFEWTSLIGGGISTGVGLLTSWLRDRQQPSGGRYCLQGQVSGDEAMSNCKPVVMALFDALEIEIAYGQLSPADAINRANEIASVFSNNFYFDQQIGGRSREIREAAKIEARQRADAIIATVEQMYAAQQAAAQQAAAAQATQTTAGEFDPKWILYGGAALLAVVLITK